MLAALCWPAYAVGLVLLPSGWFYRDQARLVVQLHRRHHARWWVWAIVFLAIHITLRWFAAAGDVVLIVSASVLAYVTLVLVCIALRRRELRPPAERRGFIRSTELPSSGWLLVRVEHRDGAVRGFMSDVLGLITARVPPGETVGAAPSYDALEQDLTSIGFAPVPGARGRVALTVPGHIAT